MCLYVCFYKVMTVSCVYTHVCACSFAYACELVCHECVYTCECMCVHVCTYYLMLLSLVLYSMPGLLLIYHSRWSWVSSDSGRKWMTEREYEHWLETTAKFICACWVWLLTHLAAGALTSGLPMSQRRTPCLSSLTPWFPWRHLTRLLGDHACCHKRQKCSWTEQWAKHMSALPEIQVNTSTPADHGRELCCQLSGT